MLVDTIGENAQKLLYLVLIKVAYLLMRMEYIQLKDTELILRI